MATVKYYLDTRATKPGCPAPIRLAIRICNSAAYLTTGVCVLPSEWNATLGKVVANRRRQFLNDYLEQFRMQVVNMMFDLKLKGELYTLSARQIRDRYLSSVAKTVAPRFYDWALEQAETKGAVRRSSIQSTLRHLELFEPRVREWSFAAELTIYWGRHTWATLAAGLDVPKDTIAVALGHGGNTVTDVYIDFDRRKVDVANRRVIDLVLHGE